MEILKSKKTMWEKFYRTMEKQEERSGKVITLTLNPEVTQTIIVDELVSGQENELYTMTADIGGLGIEVSRILSGCGYGSMCAGFEYSIDKKTLEQFMQVLKMPYVFASAEGKMRSVVRILNKNGQPATEIKEQGWKVSGTSLKDLNEKRKKVMSNLKNDDVLVVCGDVPAGVPENIYQDWIAEAKKKGARTVICAEGVLFEKSLMENPYAVVLEKDKISCDSSSKTPGNEELYTEMKYLLNKGVSIVCAYDADHQFVIMNSNGIQSGKAYLKDSVCNCGSKPSVIAGLCMALICNKEEDASKYVQAVLNGTLHKPGNGMCTAMDFEKYF